MLVDLDKQLDGIFAVGNIKTGLIDHEAFVFWDLVRVLTIPFNDHTPERHDVRSGSKITFTVKGNADIHLIGYSGSQDEDDDDDDDDEGLYGSLLDEEDEEDEDDAPMLSPKGGKKSPQGISATNNKKPKTESPKGQKTPPKDAKESKKAAEKKEPKKAAEKPKGKAKGKA